MPRQKNLLKKRFPYTAVLAASERAAQAFHRAAAEAGLRIPEDVCLLKHVGQRGSGTAGGGDLRIAAACGRYGCGGRRNPLELARASQDG